MELDVHTWDYDAAARSWREASELLDTLLGWSLSRRFRRSPALIAATRELDAAIEACTQTSDYLEYRRAGGRDGLNYDTSGRVLIEVDQTGLTAFDSSGTAAGAGGGSRQRGLRSGRDRSVRLRDDPAIGVLSRAIVTDHRGLPATDPRRR